METLSPHRNSTCNTCSDICSNQKRNKHMDNTDNHPCGNRYCNRTCKKEKRRKIENFRILHHKRALPDLP